MQAVINKIVITLSTVPERLYNDHPDGIKAVLFSVCNQNHNNYEVHFNIPSLYNITGEKYILPDWLTQYSKEYQHLKIFRTEDYGPPTKIIPTILRESKDTLLIVVDDDLIYHEDMINEHVKYQSILKNSAVLYDGRSLVNPKYGDLRDSWVICVEEISRVKNLQHYKSCSYFVGYFEEDFFANFVGKTKSDDVLVSYYLNYKGIELNVIPYERDLEKIKSYDDWRKFQGVETFPVIKHARSISNTGCNHPEILKNEPKFFIPNSFK